VRLLLPRPLASVRLAAVTIPLGLSATFQVLELPAPCVFLIFGCAVRLLLALLGVLHLLLPPPLALVRRAAVLSTLGCSVTFTSRSWAPQAPAALARL